MQQINECRWRILYSLGYRFPIFQFALGNPACRLACEFAASLRVVTDDKAPDRQAPADNGHHAARSGLQLFIVVVGNHSAQRNTAILPHVPYRGLENLATDVFKTDIDAVRTGCGNARGNGFAGLVVGYLLS